jgi:hypothetical protein
MLNMLFVFNVIIRIDSVILVAYLIMLYIGKYNYFRSSRYYIFLNLVIGTYDISYMYVHLSIVRVQYYMYHSLMYIGT